MRRLFAVLSLLLLLNGIGMLNVSPQHASASTAVLSFDVDYFGTYSWGTILSMAGPGGGANCCVTQSNTISLQQFYPTTRACHYRVFYRIAGSNNDYHSATTTIYPRTGYIPISYAPEPLANRYDTQLDCDGFVGAVQGYAYAN